MHHEHMKRDWSRLGPAIVGAYQDLGMRHSEFARLANVSLSTLHRVERGLGAAPSDTTIAKIETALGWPRGTAVGIADGQEAPPPSLPIPIRTPATPDSVMEQLPTQVRDELYRDGEVLGVDVVDLGPDGSGARMIVVVKRDPEGADPSPETLRATLEEWQRKRKELWRQGDAPPA